MGLIFSPMWAFALKMTLLLVAMSSLLAIIYTYTFSCCYFTYSIFLQVGWLFLCFCRLLWPSGSQWEHHIYFWHLLLTLINGQIMAMWLVFWLMLNSQLQISLNFVLVELYAENNIDLHAFDIQHQWIVNMEGGVWALEWLLETILDFNEKSLDSFVMYWIPSCWSDLIELRVIELVLNWFVSLFTIYIHFSYRFHEVGNDNLSTHTK